MAPIADSPDASAPPFFVFFRTSRYSGRSVTTEAQAIPTLTSMVPKMALGTLSHEGFVEVVEG